ncbi:hypothetical protein OsJ_15842 [Oryza sativa Japonica Group]|uniref:Uncharacterized protein n=1 Tax=Oryza sativa subsp. japonica TaxID=39947 RepID=A3AWK5_ORYSJ|nr:hypothetical protein OsJ_15842 [Oryza sativa Japonica Group]
MEWAYYGSGYSSSGTPSPVGGDGDEDSYMTVSSAPPKRRAGRTKFKETRHPVYKGVRSRNPGRWVCEGYLDMAQGMLIEPPPLAGQSTWAEEDYDCEVNLWSY